MQAFSSLCAVNSQADVVTSEHDLLAEDHASGVELLSLPDTIPVLPGHY